MKKKMLYLCLVFIVAMEGSACGNLKDVNQVSSVAVEQTADAAAISSDTKEGTNIGDYVTSLELPDSLSGYKEPGSGDVWSWLFTSADTGSLTTVDLPEEEITDDICYAYGGIMRINHAAFDMNNGAITKVSDFDNQAIVPVASSSMETIEDCSTDAVLLQAVGQSLSADMQQKYSATKYWCAFFAKEDCPYTFVLFLNEAYFSKEDMTKLAQSVKFADNAFSEW